MLLAMLCASNKGDETTEDDKISLHVYIKKQKRITAWAGILEAIICCEVFRIEINTFLSESFKKDTSIGFETAL